MMDRGISFKPDELSRLSDAIDKAAKKGSKETLVLMGDNALIVSVKNRTVVTAMDREAMKENVFTNIDSTVIL
jgi:flagellar operon protein